MSDSNHARKSDGGRETSNDRQSVQPMGGPIKCKRYRVYLPGDTSPIASLRSIASAMATHPAYPEGYPHGTRIIESGVTIATWEVRIQTSTKLNIGHWVLSPVAIPTKSVVTDVA